MLPKQSKGNFQKTYYKTFRTSGRPIQYFTNTNHEVFFDESELLLPVVETEPQLVRVRTDCQGRAPLAGNDDSGHLAEGPLQHALKEVVLEQLVDAGLVA